MSPRPNVSDERKSQILNAAEGVFTRKGFAEARMDDIAEETGLSKGTLYLYFKSKDDLILSILDRIFQLDFRQLEKLDRKDASAREVLLSLIEVIAEDATRIQRLLPILYNFLALSIRNRTVQQALKAYIHRYVGFLTPIIQRGIDSGEFRSCDASEVAAAMSALIEGTGLLWMYDKEFIDPARHLRSGMRLLLDGLQASP